MKNTRLLSSLCVICALSACTLGPNYVKPDFAMPSAFKEDPGWKIAEPKDDALRGNWWEVFGDPVLNDLVAQVASSNQDVQVALAQYRQARATAQASRANFFPELGADASADRSHSKSTTGNSYKLSLDASWEPDLWGSVARSVEAGNANAQANAALVASTRLSAQAELVQDYFGLRVSDELSTLQAQTVDAYTRALQLTQNQLDAGIITRADVAQAQTQLKSAQAQAIDLGIQRAQFEHAIAILIGKPPSAFSLAPTKLAATLPQVPIGLPSALLERRPDIAAAERRAAAANAQIGVARAAYFPNLSLNASGGYQNSNLGDLLNAPSLVWTLGAGLAQTIFDGGLRHARSDEAAAAYDAAVAQYRQTVLGGLQEVEDNLVALRLLADEAIVQRDTVAAAQEAERLAFNQYKAGLVSYTNVVSTQAAANASQRAALQLLGRQYTGSALLIKGLGGGWQGIDQPVTQ